MPLYSLTKEIAFPDPHCAEDDGLLAMGGDLSPERLLLAYSHGIFPWYSDDSPILWWALNPRMILKLDDFKVSKSLLSKIRKANFKIRFDTNFEEVILNCSKSIRKDQESTWITEDMKTAYLQLHKMGFAHSVETYVNNELVGGLYGVSLGRVFFGESMFHKQTDASKIAFYHLVKQLKVWNFDMIDAQMETPLLNNFGALNITFESYYVDLQASLKNKTHRGNWGGILEDEEEIYVTSN